MSIVGIPLRSDQYVNGFSIDTWKVEFKAVCHIPPGWQITAGGSVTPDGLLSGQGSHGVTFLSESSLKKELKGLVLVTIAGSVQRREMRTADTIRPATFSGHASIGAMGGAGHDRNIRLSYANIRLTHTSRCPPPSR